MVAVTLAEAFQRISAADAAGRFADGERICRSILAADPDNCDALCFLGLMQHRRGRRVAALATYDRALALAPDQTAARINRAVILQELGRDAEALAAFDAVLASHPGDPDTLGNRGLTYQKMGRTADALADYDAALAVAPDHAPSLNNRGVLLKEQKRYDAALASFDRLVAVRPDAAEAFNNRGTVFQELRRFAEALADYDRALALRSDYADAHHNRANVLNDLGRRDEAIASYDRALALRPDDADAHAHRGKVLMLLKRHDAARESFERALACDPGHRRAAGGLAECALELCDFAAYGRLADGVRRRVADGTAMVSPYVLQFYSDDPALHLAGARRFVDDLMPVPPQPLWRGDVWRNDRIRLAYVSADIRQHPVAALITELIETHDRSRFEVVGVSLGPDDGSAVRARLVAAFDRCHDVRAMTDRDAARLLHDGRTDIVVDLTGFTLDCRPEIFACRPAPIAVGYLGYPSTMGAAFIDYILADAVILPFDQQAFYSEHIVHLPGCYQANPRARPDAATPTRAAAGLPEDAFVFCCFNRHSKIAAPMFDVWMRLLHAVAGSVLWLTAAPDAAVANLRREAAGRGIDPERLIFARKTVRVEDHFARHRLADLFLDTLPYNAHTTASDALWTGLPVLTCRGRALAGRVAASLAAAAGEPELVTESLAAYEALALRLATDKALLAGYRARLARTRATCPLFDADRFRRHIERAYTTMWEAWQSGAPPRGFAVEPDGR